MKGLLLVTLTLALSALSDIGRVAAGPGVGVSTGEIRVEDRLAPGGSYRLPAIGVFNSGDQASEYQVRVGRAGDLPKLFPGEGWVKLEPARFRLAPNESRAVAVTLVLPRDARPGDYFAYLQASPVTELEGASVAIAAATKLEFTVRPATSLDAWRVWLSRKLDEAQPWPGLLAATVLAAFLVRAATRRFEVSIRRRR